MKKLNLLKTMFLLCALMVGSSAWADVVTLWSEDFSSFSANDVPSGGAYSYVCKDGGTTTKIYNEDVAGCTAPELLVSKSGGTFTATVPLDNIEGDLTLTFYTNKQEISVSTLTEDISGSLKEKAAGQHTLTFTGVTTDMTQIVIEFKGSGSSNVRLDNILLTGNQVPSDPDAPAASLSTTSLDFGTVNIGTTKSLTFTVTPANLTSALSISCDNDKYEVTPTSIAQDVIDATTITVTSKPTAVTDDMDGTITISGGGLEANKTVTLTTTAYDPNAPGSVNNPYTVAEAIENTPSDGNVYIKGIVSAFYNTSIMGDGTNYRYYISDDGTTTNQLLVYKGKDLNEAKFDDVSDLLLGDEVVICGSLIEYQNAPEVASGNYLVSKERTVVAVTGVALDETSLDLVVGDTKLLTATVSPADATDKSVSWESSNESVATVVDGLVTAVAAGDATITVTTTDGEFTATCDVTVSVVAVTGVALDESNLNLEVGAKKTLTAIISPANASDKSVSWESSNESVATVVEGLVTAVAVGNATITVTTTDGEFTATCDVTVTQPTTTTQWVKTALAALTADDVFVIVGTNADGYSYAMSNDKGTSSAPVAVEVTVSEGQLTGNIAENIQWNVSGNATDGYTFYPNEDSESWLYCTNTNNGVRVGTNTNSTFAISEEGYLFHKGTSRYVGIYNSQDWRCYTSINANIKEQTFAFYKKVATAYATVTSAGWATYITPAAVEFAEDEAYVVTDASIAQGLALEAITEAPANTPVLLKGAGEKTFNVVASADAPETNLLTVCDGTIEDGYYAYVLAKKGDGATFKQWTGEIETLNGRVILPLDQAVASAREFFDLDGETTGIDAMHNAQCTMHNEVFDLQGRRVAQPTKGLYIVNGKKYVIK